MDLRNDADVIIIGGGAAGLFAGCLLAKYGRKTIIIEPNRKTGRKLRITGKGRCNLTNNCSCEDVIKNTVSNSKFLYSCLSGFSPADTMAWFEDHGVPLKTERGGRVFPQSDKADDIADTLEKTFKHHGGRIVQDRAQKIICENGMAAGVKCNQFEYFAPSVILATGGKSYPKTGSTGDGYEMAKNLGHTVTPIRPSLVPVVLKESFCADICWLALKNVTLSLYDIKKKNPIYRELGEMNFMPYGISGPLTLTASCYMKPEKLAAGEYRIVIDLKPGLTEEQLFKRLQRDYTETPMATFRESLARLLPSMLIETVVDLSGIDPEKPCNQITKAERAALIGLLKGLPLTPIALRPIDEAIITGGGISVKEINQSTMESKLVKGLYFAGEIIDMDAQTGGFNLQIAFSTAFAAASSILDI